MSDDDVHLYFDLDSRDLRPIVGKGVLQFDPQDVKSNVGRGFIEEKQNKNTEISVLEKQNIFKDDCGLNNECNNTIQTTNKTDNKESSLKSEIETGLNEFIKRIKNFFKGEETLEEGKKDLHNNTILTNNKTDITENSLLELDKETGINGFIRRIKNFFSGEDESKTLKETLEEGKKAMEETLEKGKESIKKTFEKAVSILTLEQQREKEDLFAKKITENLNKTLVEISEALKSKNDIPRAVFAKWGEALMDAVRPNLKQKQQEKS